MVHFFVYCFSFKGLVWFSFISFSWEFSLCVLSFLYLYRAFLFFLFRAFFFFSVQLFKHSKNLEEWCTVIILVTQSIRGSTASLYTHIHISDCSPLFLSSSDIFRIRFSMFIELCHRGKLILCVCDERTPY